MNLAGIKAILTNPLVIVVVAALAFFGGRQTAPVSVKVVETVKTVEIHHEQTVITQKVDLQELKQLVASLQRRNNVVTTRVIEVKPDGTKTEHETIADRTETDTKTATTVATDTKTDATNTTTKDSLKTDEKTKLVEKLQRPSPWGAGVIMGVPLVSRSGLIDHIPRLDDVSVSVFAGRRLFWNISADIWVSSKLDAGLGLMVGF
jgi:hypothetical protein